MTPQQIDLVRRSFQRVAPMAPLVAALFYDKLFAANPSLRSLFRSDLKQQGERLMQMITVAVRLLDEPDKLQAPLRALGQRHAGYGVHDSHYASVGAALIDTLAEGLADAFTADVRGAWIAMYSSISNAMIAASRESVAAQAA